MITRRAYLKLTPALLETLFNGHVSVAAMFVTGSQHLALSDDPDAVVCAVVSGHPDLPRHETGDHFTEVQCSVAVDPQTQKRKLSFTEVIP